MNILIMRIYEIDFLLGKDFYEIIIHL